MALKARLNRQRIKYIISSYQLNGNDAEAFEHDLHLILAHYPTPLIELALVETLVDSWLQVPLLRGCDFLAKAYELLKQWENQTLLQSDPLTRQLTSTVSPEQFQQITGLDPTFIFGAMSASQPSIRASGGGF